MRGHFRSLRFLARDEHGYRLCFVETLLTNARPGQVCFLPAHSLSICEFQMWLYVLHADGQ